MTRAALLSLLLLAACGVDGAPTAPETTVTPGISFGGTVEAGVAVDGGV